MRIVYIQYTNPAGYPPLEHSSRLLVNAGWKVLFVGTGSFGASSLSLPAHPNIEVKKLGFCSSGMLQKVHYLAYGFRAFCWAVTWRARWIYASDVMSCPIALALSFLPGIRVIYHEHDSPSTVAKSRFERLLLVARRLLAARAFCSVLPNHQRLEQFQCDTGGRSDRVACVWNCPARDEIWSTRGPSHMDNIRLLYHGSIVPDRLPLAVVDALATLSTYPITLRVVGYETAGSRGYLDEIRKKAESLRILDRIEIIGTVATRRELLKCCRESDIGLALMPAHSEDLNMRAMVGASNKPFDYLACGLALIVSDLPDWRTTFVEPGYGVACNPQDPESVVRAIRSLIADPSRMRMMGERGRQRIESEWNYEAQFTKIYDLLSGDGRPVSRAELTSTSTLK